MRRHAALVATALLMAPVVWLNGAETTDPRALLGTVRASTGLTVWPLDGVLKKAPGVYRWRVYLNDAKVFESPADAARADAALNVALILREGDNLIAIESVATDGEAAERWTTHIHRAGGATARQFAVLAHGAGADASDAGPLAAFRKALTDHGVPREDVSTVSSWEALARAISDLGRRTSGKDRVLIYYTGPGSLRSTNAEPVLIFPKTPGAIDTVPVGNLVREASDLPSASVLLDIDYVSAAVDVHTPARQTPTGASAPWLRGITQADSVELAFTSPLLATSAAAQSGFTHDFIASLDVPDASSPDTVSPCATFANMSQRIASVNAVTKTAAWPVFYSRAPTSFQFCASAGSSSRELHVTAAASVSANPPLRFAQIDLPRAADVSEVPFELSVDGVPVQRGLRGARAATQQLPIGPGRHVVALTATPPASVSLTSTVGGETAGVRSQRRSPDLTAELVDGATHQVTSDLGVTLRLVVGDRTDHPIRVEIRNNGVVVQQELIPNPSKDLRIQIARRIPLAIGANNIAVDVKRDNQLASTRALVVRRRSQPVRAVIVGVNRPRGAKTALKHAASDADRIHRLVLQYTDAVPSRVRLLKDERATKQAIIDAITEIGRLPVPDALVPFDGPGETFLLYFAGFGVSFADAAGRPPVRCLLPADFSAASAARERETCLRTDDLDAMLDKVGRSLVIVDASVRWTRRRRQPHADDVHQRSELAAHVRDQPPGPRVPRRERRERAGARERLRRRVHGRPRHRDPDPSRQGDRRCAGGAAARRGPARARSDQRRRQAASGACDEGDSVGAVRVRAQARSGAEAGSGRHRARGAGRRGVHAQDRRGSSEARRAAVREGARRRRRRPRRDARPRARAAAGGRSRRSRQRDRSRAASRSGARFAPGRLDHHARRARDAARRFSTRRLPMPRARRRRRPPAPTCPRCSGCCTARPGSTARRSTCCSRC